jgi:hypothetical protein
MEHFRPVTAAHGAHAVLVPEDEISRFHDDATAADWMIDKPELLLERALDRAATREYREAEAGDLCRVTDEPVDDKAGDASRHRDDAHELAPWPALPALHVGDEHLPAVGDIECLVEHEIVARLHLDGECRAAEPHVVTQGLDGGGHCSALVVGLVHRCDG